MTKIKTGWNLENTYATLPKLFFSTLKPTNAPSPELIILNNSLAQSLGLNIEALENKEGIEILAGNSIPENSIPLAQAYAGHQFGHFTMLGDGRALLLGEQITPLGKRFDVQLKGSGKTPYSRGGDGLATLGPMLREYIISEAMYGLGIPTTRSLAVVRTGQTRENNLPCAILSRVAASHLRIGTFQYAANWGTDEELKILADYTIKRHFPQIEDNDNPYLSLLQEVIKKQALLIAKWQLLGFIHGVMNTDNMTISGETIDYGPCAFLNIYNPKTVFSSIDRRGRYAYKNQPPIGEWNLARFAETLLPLLDDKQEKAVKLAKDTVSSFAKLYRYNWLKGMRSKLGIFNEEIEDESLIEDLLNMMEKYKLDYTNTFLALTFDNFEDEELYNSKEFNQWYKRWQQRLERQQESKEYSHQLMKKNNPALIPRNHRVEEALDAAVQKGDYSIMKQLLNVLSNPYAHSPEQVGYSTPPEPSDIPYQTFCGT
ncbi:protein adenylyltransferase SelO [Orenia marismortui]|uniref:protein adenylyltransferase SelO n=1 Tax=Orenia marismortui TaxID=46469 RepID=UPI000374A29E|nr:YdiU family protein [Orenia marismortui]